MKKIFARAWRGSLFQKSAFEESFWDDDATADAVILVGVVSGAIVLITSFVAGSLGVGLVLDLVGSVISGVASWLILALCVWVAATKVFKTGGGIQTMMATHGLAYLPLGLSAFPNRYVGIAALVWYLAVLVVATRAATDSDQKLAGLSVLVGFAILALIDALLSGITFQAVSAFNRLF